MLLAMQIFQVGLDNIPPVTLAFLGLNVAVYYLDYFDLPLNQVCIGAYYVWKHMEGTHYLYVICAIDSVAGNAIDSTRLYWRLKKFFDADCIGDSTDHKEPKVSPLALCDLVNLQYN